METSWHMKPTETEMLITMKTRIMRMTTHMKRMMTTKMKIMMKRMNMKRMMITDSIITRITTRTMIQTI